MENKFVHLKLHTEYSLLEGVGKIDEYVEKAKEIGVKALAIGIKIYQNCRQFHIAGLHGIGIKLNMMN